MSLPLAGLSRAELEYLRKAIAKRQLPTPLSALALEASGRGTLWARLGPLVGASEEVALALLDLALATGGAPVVSAPAALVWTGPDVPLSAARATTAVVLELLAAAREQVLIAGYELDHGAVLFGPLHQAMALRGVRARIFMDVRPAPSPRSNVDAYLALRTHHFLQRNWPFGDPLPELFHYPAGAQHGSQRSLHAKCIVVDGRYVLIGSANFTARGHQRNVEVGVRLDDPVLAAALTGQFDRLVEAGELAPLPVLAARHAAPPVEAENDGESRAAEDLAAELLVSDAARALFVRLVAGGLPAPAVGEDLEGPRGDVLGTAELSWDEARVAVLLPEQEAGRRKLEAAGWRCFAVALDAAGYVALCELVGGGS